MKTSTKIAAQLLDQERQLARLGSSSQLGSSSIGGENAVPLAETVAEAAYTNDAMPVVQDDAADVSEGVTDLQDTLSASDDDLDARLEDAYASLDDKAAEIADSMQDISDAFDVRVDGISEDVETAISAAGSAKTEAEAASDAALAAAGLAASKGKTIVQVSAPTGSNADPANLWINISTDSNGVPKNQPNRYNPDTSKWEPITDAQAVAAAQNAATAVAAAQAAKDVADQANAAAGVAKTAADNANTAALQAAGIANGKGKVIYQASKPTGMNAAAGNLWIRTSDNTPWAYDVSIPDWVQVTDQTAKDAAAAAVQAQQAATAAANAAQAAQATADSKPLILFSSTAGPSGTAPTGSTWFLWDSAKNIAGQWLQEGTLANPVWTPQQITSQVIANLDLGKLTAGSAAIADLVAQKIAASTANFQTANVSNLFVTSGATMSQAVIDFLFANVVQAKKITADMIDANALNGKLITGATIRTGATYPRMELVQNTPTSTDPTARYASGGLAAIGQTKPNANGVVTTSYAILRPNPDSDAATPQFVIDSGPVDSGGFSYERLLQTGTSIARQVDPYQVLPAPLGNMRAPTYWKIYLPGGQVAGSIKAEKAEFSSVTSPKTGRMLLGDTDWITPTLSNANQDATTPFRYRLYNGFVVFDGLITLTSNSVGANICVLPAGFRPATQRQYWVLRNGSTPNGWMVRFYTGGTVTLVGPSGGSGQLEMANITPYPADN